MGTWAGHVLPGSMFLLIGVWASFITAIRYIQSKMKSQYKQKSSYKYRGTTDHPCICFPCYSFRRAPIESMLKILLTSIGIIGEIATGLHYRTVPLHKAHIHNHNTEMPMNEHNHKRDIINSTINTGLLESTSAMPEMKEELWFLPGNAQHITMYLGFLLASLITVLRYKKFDIPLKLEWFMNGLAFAIEGYLFSTHSHGLNQIEVHVHSLLVYSIIGCIIFGGLEVAVSDNIMLSFGRCFFIILQGTWFIMVAFVLYPDEIGLNGDVWKWDATDMGQIMFLSCVFFWHIFIIITLIVIKVWIMKRVYLKSAWIAEKFDELLLIDIEIEKASDDIFYSDPLRHSSSSNGNGFHLLSDEEISESEKLIFDTDQIRVTNTNL